MKVVEATLIATWWAATGTVPIEPISSATPVNMLTSTKKAKPIGSPSLKRARIPAASGIS